MENKLTKSEELVRDMIVKNLESGKLWERGWNLNGAPRSIHGTKYHNSNELLLFLISENRGYKDMRWVTFNQMTKNGWSFKKLENGESAGKGQGVPVFYFEMRDRKTKKPYDRNALKDLSDEERAEYFRENVYPLKKSYIVFNGDLIDGIPALPVVKWNENDKNERVENFLKFWNDTQSKIVYGGYSAHYNVNADEIHLPVVTDFKNAQEFYATALHELAHSTGAKNRLNRELQNEFGSEKYALEELRAEIASCFICAEFEVRTADGMQNNSAYANSWLKAIKTNPNALFEAISDADKILKYVLEMEKAITPAAETVAA